ASSNTSVLAVLVAAGSGASPRWGWGFATCPCPPATEARAPPITRAAAAGGRVAPWVRASAAPRAGAAAWAAGGKARDVGGKPRREPFGELRRAGDERRRGGEEIVFGVCGGAGPIRDHGLERAADTNERCVVLDDGDRRRYHAQQRLVHGAQPHRAVGVFGGQQPARDEFFDQCVARRIAALEVRTRDRHDRERLEPAGRVD